MPIQPFVTLQASRFQKEEGAVKGKAVTMSRPLLLFATRRLCQSTSRRHVAAYSVRMFGASTLATIDGETELVFVLNCHIFVFLCFSNSRIVDSNLQADCRLACSPFMVSLFLLAQPLVMGQDFQIVSNEWEKAWQCQTNILDKFMPSTGP